MRTHKRDMTEISPSNKTVPCSEMVSRFEGDKIA